MTAEASPTPQERSRKAFTRFLQAMEKPGTGGELAKALDTSDASVSRIKNEHMQGALSLLYALGFKVVDASAYVVDAETYAFLTRSHARVMARNPELIWEPDSEFGGLS